MIVYHEQGKSDMIEHMEVVGLCLLLIIGGVGVVYRYIIIPKRRLEQFSRELSMIFTRTKIGRAHV